MYACICKGITEDQVRDVGSLGISAPGELISVLALDDASCCGRCVAHIEEFVELAREGASQASCVRPSVTPRSAVLVGA